MPRPAGALGVVQVARRVVLTASARRLAAATAAALLLGGQALLMIAGEAATSPGRRRGLARGQGSYTPVFLAVAVCSLTAVLLLLAADRAHRQAAGN